MMAAFLVYDPARHADDAEIGYEKAESLEADN
jgi:hypothetical protein